MTKEKPSGWTAPQHLKGFSIHCCKNSQISLAFHQRRVFNLLSDGIPRTIADIFACQTLGALFVICVTKG